MPTEAFFRAAPSIPLNHAGSSNCPHFIFPGPISLSRAASATCNNGGLKGCVSWVRDTGTIR